MLAQGAITKNLISLPNELFQCELIDLLAGITRQGTPIIDVRFSISIQPPAPALPIRLLREQ